MDNKYRILVVDDDPAIVNIIETDLVQEGYTVITADNGSIIIGKLLESIVHKITTLTIKTKI